MLVRYFAGAAEASGQKTQVVDAADMNADSLVDLLGKDNPRLAKILGVSTLLADGARLTNRSAPLRDVTQIDVLPPFAGG